MNTHRFSKKQKTECTLYTQFRYKRFRERIRHGYLAQIHHVSFFTRRPQYPIDCRRQVIASKVFAGQELFSQRRPCAHAPRFSREFPRGGKTFSRPRKICRRSDISRGVIFLRFLGEKISLPLGAPSPIIRKLDVLLSCLHCWELFASSFLLSK